MASNTEASMIGGGIFRRAQRSDLKVVLEMMAEICEILGLEPPTEEELVKKCGMDEGGDEKVHIYLMQGFVNDEVTTVACAFCYPEDSVWKGRQYCLKDMYIKPDYRYVGVGARIGVGICETAKKLNRSAIFKYSMEDFFRAKLGSADFIDVIRVFSHAEK
ncbi:uncharacterized protein LOC131800641 [Musca domestica]|uniref:Uncharacterized protein LOC101898843 n=1 Tax=Musca domestica TaxID=7370 RepID=A0A1I8NHH9_MUSDO|nr:uncharacterized protein LOC101898843 [Musca domestica]XP_058974168.1 uncharacterized protein LOC131800641 [Musca domestica]